MTKNKPILVAFCTIAFVMGVAAERTRPDTSRFKPSVEPLLTTKWGQREPFKFMCPFDTWFPDRDLDGTYQPDMGHYSVGCVATAMAQYMNFYRFPTHGVGIDAVDVEYEVPGQSETTTVSYSVNFAEATYDWDNMLDDYQGEYTPEQGEAVAQLCYHCGVAAHSLYNYLGAGSTDAKCLWAFINHFNYSDKAHYIVRSNYDEPTWMEMIYSELSQGRPILYSAKDINIMAGIIASHNFIIDGYNEDGLVHVNWGWYGLEDGYYDIALLNPREYTYDEWQAMYVGLYPNREAVVGDITGDGIIDITDVNELIDMLLGNTASTPAADITDDGIIDVADMDAIIDIVLGK